MIPDLEWQLITWRSSWRFHPVITVSVCQLTKHGKFACKPHRLSWRVLLCKESSFHFFGNKTVNECARLQANLGWVNVLAHIRFKTSEKKIDLSGTSKTFCWEGWVAVSNTILLFELKFVGKCVEMQIKCCCCNCLYPACLLIYIFGQVACDYARSTFIYSALSEK